MNKHAYGILAVYPAQLSDNDFLSAHNRLGMFLYRDFQPSVKKDFVLTATEHGYYGKISTALTYEWLVDAMNALRSLANRSDEIIVVFTTDPYEDKGCRVIMALTQVMGIEHYTLLDEGVN